MDADKLNTVLRDIRDMLDDIDAAPFGDVPKMLDRMAAMIDEAMREAEENV